MTSTISQPKRKSSAMSMIKWSVRRHSALLIVYSILLFIAFPLISFWFNSVNLIEAYDDYANTIYELTTDMAYYFYPFSGLVVSLFAILLGVFLFSFLHNKRSVDMFTSLPITRRSLFLSKYAAGIIMLVSPLLITMVISMLSVLRGGVEAILYILINMLFILLGGVAVYSLTVFLCVSCGKTSDAVLSALAICICTPIALALTQYIAGSYVPGMTEIISFPTIVYMMLSPQAVAFAGAFSYDFKESLSVELFVFIGYWLLFIGLMIFGGIKVLNKRKMECAQISFSFRLPAVIIRFVVTYTAGLVLGFILSKISVFSIEDSKGTALNHFWFWVGVVVASFAAHIIVELIYNKGLKGFAKSLLPYGVVLATIAGLYVYTITGFFGADLYVPKAEEIESVCINTEYTHKDDAFFDSSSEGIGYVLAAHKEITEKIRDIKGYPYTGNAGDRLIYDVAENYDYKETPYIFYDVEFVYKLKNGDIVRRTYNSDIQSISKAQINIFKFCDRKEYYINNLAIFNIDPSGITSMDCTYTASVSSDEIYLESEPTKEQAEKFLKAFKSDFLKYGNVNRVINGHESLNCYRVSIYYNFETARDFNSMYDEFCIPEEFTETVKCLEEMGLIH